MRFLVQLYVGGFLALLIAPGVRSADEPAKPQFQTIALDTLSESAGKFEWTKAEFLDALKGSEGWEVLLTSSHAALFRKAKDGPKWEYKAVKVKNSPFASPGLGGMKDTEAYAVILDRMAADGYTPCAINGLGEYTLFKRVKDGKHEKTEFQTLLWSDHIKSKNAPADRFKEKEFLETLNKQGSEGWEVCVCNIEAVVFTKSKVKWEYKTIKVTKSPLQGVLKGEDDEAEAFKLILEGLEAKGWKPCACDSGVSMAILLKRIKSEEKPPEKKKD